MSKNNIKTSGFSLAKRKELTGDDFYEIKQLDEASACRQIEENFNSIFD